MLCIPLYVTFLGFFDIDLDFIPHYIRPRHLEIAQDHTSRNDGFVIRLNYTINILFTS